MMRGSLGLLAGGEAQSQIIFSRTLARSTQLPRNSECGADVKASAIKASAGTSAGMTRGGHPVLRQRAEPRLATAALWS